jgi:predicted alpha/beta superfamily hydrolase
MRRLLPDVDDMIYRTCVLLLCLLFSASVRAGEPVIIGQSHRLHSAVLNEDRDYRVLLPDSYGWAKDRHYPVLYLLDGETEFIHTAASVSYLAAHGEIPEMIVVALVSTVRVRDFTQTDWPSRWIGGGGAGNFKRFLSAEFIPAINHAYRTDGFRVLSGHSAGGQFALYCLTSEPSLFKAYIALSPSLDWDDNLPQRSLEKSFESTKRLPAFLYVARSDDSGRALADYDRLVQTLKTKSPEGFRWHSQPFPEETHVNVPLLAEIDALRHLYAGYRLHPDLLEKGFAFAQQHFQEVSKTVGWPLGIPETVINDLGYAALSQGKIDEAIALFKRNVEANPNSANAFDGLADGFAKAGRWREAAQSSDRSSELAAQFNLPTRAYFLQQSKKLHDRLNQESKGTQAR